MQVVTKFAGDGKTRPRPGQVCRVHYKAFLLGSDVPFEDSRDRGRAFEFKIGAGQVCKGWEEGLRSMTVGERALLTLDPEVAYGSAGHPPIIPPNSSIVFDVQLIRVYWSDIEDRTDTGVIEK